MSFVQQVNARYQVVEAKISGLREHPLSERIKLIKKPKVQEGISTVIAFDLVEGTWTNLFGKFAKVTESYNIPLKPPLDKTPHVTLAYIVNATESEIKQAMQLAKTISQEPLVVYEVVALLGADKNTYIALHLQVTSGYRKLYNEITKIVGRNRVKEFRDFWKGHIPHASIGIIDKKFSDKKEEIKLITRRLTDLVKSEQIKFMPKFVEIHKDTKLGNKFSPEMIDYDSLVDA